jgi:hypothetical protein
MWKLFRKGTGMAGFIDQINALRDTASLEDKLADIQTWMDRLWQRGVTAMADISNCADSFAIKAASPMYTRTFLEVFGTEPQDCAAVIRDVKALQEQALACGLDAAPTPHACYTMSPELLTAASAEGLRSGYLSYHSEETPEEDEMIRSGSGPMWENRKRAGMSTPPVTGTSSLQYFLERLQQVHAAPFDEHILLVHEVCMDQEGIDAVKAALNHPFIALCPLSNLFIHNALPPVELLRSNGMKLTIHCNLPLGAIPDWAFQAQEADLAPDSTIFLYTDGLDEAENAGGKFFGKSRLKEVLKGTPPYPRTIIEQMTQAVNDFVGETEQSDDLTMLALKWKK